MVLCPVLIKQAGQRGPAAVAEKAPSGKEPDTLQKYGTRPAPMNPPGEQALSPGVKTKTFPSKEKKKLRGNSIRRHVASPCRSMTRLPHSLHVPHPSDRSARGGLLVCERPRTHQFSPKTEQTEACTQKRSGNSLSAAREGVWPLPGRRVSLFLQDHPPRDGQKSAPA